jgi:hypothetical protein
MHTPSHGAPRVGAHGSRGGVRDHGVVEQQCATAHKGDGPLSGLRIAWVNGIRRVRRACVRAWVRVCWNACVLVRAWAWVLARMSKCLLVSAAHLLGARRGDRASSSKCDGPIRYGHCATFFLHAPPVCPAPPPRVPTAAREREGRTSALELEIATPSSTSAPYHTNTAPPCCCRRAITSRRGMARPASRAAAAHRARRVSARRMPSIRVRLRDSVSE